MEHRSEQQRLLTGRYKSPGGRPKSKEDSRSPNNPPPIRLSTTPAVRRQAHDKEIYSYLRRTMVVSRNESE